MNQGFEYYRVEGYKNLNFAHYWRGDYLTNLVLQKILAETKEQEYAKTLTWDMLGENSTLDQRTTILAKLLGIEKDKVPEKFTELLKQANKEVMSKYEEFNIHLEGSEVTEVTIDRKDRFNTEDFDPNKQPSKQNLPESTAIPVKVFVDKDTKIGRFIATESSKDVVVLVGTTDVDHNKFKGFTNLVVTKADWTLSDKDFKYTDTVKVENSTLHLNGTNQNGNLTSGHITNDKTH